MLAMSFFALAKTKTNASQPVKIKAKARANMRVIFHIKDILNDSQQFLMQVYEMRVPNYMQIYFP